MQARFALRVQALCQPPKEQLFLSLAKTLEGPRGGRGPPNTLPINADEEALGLEMPKESKACLGDVLPLSLTPVPRVGTHRAPS